MKDWRKLISSQREPEKCEVIYWDWVTETGKGKQQTPPIRLECDRCPEQISGFCSLTSGLPCTSFVVRLYLISLCRGRLFATQAPCSFCFSVCSNKAARFFPLTLTQRPWERAFPLPPSIFVSRIGFLFIDVPLILLKVLWSVWKIGTFMSVYLCDLWEFFKFQASHKVA